MMATFDGNDVDAEQTSVIDRMDKEYKIYVNNLPEELNEDAIRQVFSPYGTITAMFYIPNTTWTYITYGSYREAELAIRELHNRKPLYLKVALAKERVVKEEFEQLDTERKPHVTEPLLVQNMKYTSYGKGRGYPIGKYITMPNMIVPHRGVQSFHSLSPLTSVYNSDDPYMSTNHLWSRGIVTVTADGKRHVSLGRGYSMYEIPNPDPKCEEYIKQIYELRKNGLYEYGDDKLRNGLYKCIVCFAKTTKHCEKCYTYYCSKACQVTHWPQHQAECERIPNLVNEIPSKQVDKNEVAKPQNQNTCMQVNAFSDVKLRRPNTPVQIQDLSTNIQRTTDTNQTNKDAKTTDKCSNNQLDNKGNALKEKIVDQPMVNAPDNRNMQNRVNRYNSNENIDQTKNDQFSTTANYRQNCYSSKNNLSNKTSPDKEINSYVKDKFDDNVGRRNFYQKDGFQNDRKLPYNQRETINTSSTINKQGQKLSMLSMDAEKTTTVEMEEQLDNLAALTTKDSRSSNMHNNATVKASQEKSLPNIEITPMIQPQLCNVLDALANLLTDKAVSELTIFGIIQISDRVQKNVYSATMIPQSFGSGMERILQELPRTCIKIAKTTSNYKPQMRELVCCESETKEWFRGYVTSLSPNYHVALVDEAKIVLATRILPYPKTFLDICTFGITCEVNNDELQTGQVYDFTGVVKEYDKTQANFKIKLKKTSERIFNIEGMIKPWRFTIHLNPIPALVKLKSGSEICLTNYRNQYTLFAHSLDESEIEYTTIIMQRVAHCSQTAPCLSKSPNIGEMVIAPYMDGNKYRAILTKLVDNIATVVYVDFGNIMDINVNELQEISDDLKFERSCSAKLLLKDVPSNIPMTAEVDAYLRDLVGREEPLVCTFDKGSFKNGVYLTTSTGENVNDKIKELLIPDWKKDNYDNKTCYMLNDLDIASLGKVGETTEALVLYQATNDKLSYMMGPSDFNLVNHIINEMPTLMQEYCEKMQYYIPRRGELCLALYEEVWYRALCLDPKKSHTTCDIMFVDYGNEEIVEHKNVRQMPETFIRPAALANICVVVNLAPVDNMGNYSAAVRQRVSELVTMNTPVDIKIVEIVEAGEYKVELPKIRAILEKEHLVPPSF